jgi:exocyst complex component 2
MALEIVQLYISLLSQFFALSDKAVATSSTDSTPLPSFVPQGSNSVVAASHLSKILGDISESVSDVSTAELSGDAALGLRNLLESARWKFEVALCQLWLQGNSSSYLHDLLFFSS